MQSTEEIQRRLRYRVIGLIHAGRLEPGDRLPSIRQLARETGADHRAVARAYQGLAAEGLVEIRPDSGVFVAWREEGDAALEGEARWLAELLAEGWQRGVPRERLGHLVTRSASVRPLCACIESNEDHMVALSAELEELFSLKVAQVRVGPDADAGEVAEALPPGVELAITSVFHAAAAGEAARRAGVPFLALTFHPEFTAQIEQRLSEGGMTVVIADPHFAARGQAYLSVTSHSARVRFVLADRVEQEGIDPDAPEVLVTRAARRRLGLKDHHLIAGDHRLISPQSARALSATIVRMALREA